MLKITILVPVYNESANIKDLHAALCSLASKKIAITAEGTQQEVDPTEYEWEFLFVNDGSRDNSQELLTELRERDPRVNVVCFSRNFGKETALLAGMDFASGDAVIIMDGDLQHPVETIPEMIYWWRRGYDDVYGKRVTRGKEPWLRRRLTRVYYKLLGNASRTPMLPGAGDFRLLSRKAINALTAIRESQRYTKGLYCWVGFNKKAVEFETRDRQAGKSTFNYRALFNLAVDGITSYTTSPLRIASVLGVVVALCAILYLMFVVVKYLIYGESVQGYPTIICLILFLGGVQLLALGIIGEYIGRIFVESKRRPPYVVDSFNGEEPS